MNGQSQADLENEVKRLSTWFQLMADAKRNGYSVNWEVAYPHKLSDYDGTHHKMKWWEAALEGREPPRAAPGAKLVDEPVGSLHTEVSRYFGHSLSSYLVLNRALLQSMPHLWQTRFVALVREMEMQFGHVKRAKHFTVQSFNPDSIQP